MKVGKILKFGIISGLMSLSSASCQKTADKFYPAKNIKSGIINRINIIKWQTHRILQDSSYKYYGNDTLEITNEIFNGTRAYINKLNKIAEKSTPNHGKNLKFTKEGTSKKIDTSKDTFIPKYIKQKTVIKSDDVFTRNGEDVYVPVEFYGIPNPKLQ